MEHMTASKWIPIQEIGIDADGHLFLRPRIDPPENLEFVWRDASGIRWDSKSRVLHAAEPARWGHLRLYQQIVSAIRNEYGNSLLLTPETRWTHMPEDLKASILTNHTAAP
jgi:hypothetical protein